MKALKFYFTALCALLAITATANPLTPEEAFSAAMGQRSNGLHRMPQKARGMEFVYQVVGNDGPTVYVFAPKAEDAVGFIVVSADDLAEPLLGYSDTERFDPNNIPPQLKWLLENYSATITEIIERPENAKLMNIANPQTTSAPMRIRRAPKAAISPICKTYWNQSTPYNNSCPVRGGQRSVTGCVATAMAQVMKVHEWPIKGKASHSYTYKYGTKTFTESFNFGTTTFDWSNMLNDYSGNYSTTQATAVATLMHACGVASDMSYSPDGSGASDLVAAAGLITYLNYDLGLHAEWRSWHLSDEWNDLIYAEIAEGRPVLYTGNDGESGHAFVCDGFDGTKYFHINWGWGGIADGYFLLADLNPAIQGIGGGSGINGFNYDQSAMLGFKKPGSSSKRPLIIACESFTTDKTNYSLAADSYISIQSNGFYNLSTCEIPEIWIGVVLEDSDGNRLFCPGASGQNLKMLYGFSFIPLFLDDLSIGKFKAYPAVATDEYGRDLALVKYDPTKCGGYLDIEVNSGVATVSVAKGQADISTDVPSDPEATTVDISLNSSNALNGCVTGKTYNFKYDFTVNGSYNETYYMMLVNYDKMAVAAQGDSKNVFTSKAGTVSQDFNLTIPATLDLSYKYIAALCTLSGNSLTVADYVDLDISKVSSSNDVQIDFVSMTPDDDPLLTDTTYKMTFSFTSENPFTAPYVLALVNYDTVQLVEDSNSVLVDLATPGSVNATFPLYIPADLPIGPQYIIAVCTITDDNYLKTAAAWYIDIKKRSGVDRIIADPTDGQLYDLQGIRIEKPAPGQIYIEKTPTGTRKLLSRP